MNATAAAKTKPKADEQPVEKIGVGTPIYNSVLEFYYLESEMLDERRFDEWQTLLTDDMIYSMPVRQVVNRDDKEVFGVEEGGIYHDTRVMLASRLLNAQKRNAWGEDPPPGARRVVTHLRLSRFADGRLFAKTNVLLTSYRGSMISPMMYSGERQDILVQTPDGIKVASRKMFLDHGSLASTGMLVPL